VKIVAEGHDNLIPLNERTKEEQREIARQGGIASGKVRQEKATMKKVLMQMLEEVADIKDNDKKLTYKQLATLGLIKGSIEGNASNYKTILETIGEMSTQLETKEPIININITNNEDVKEEFYKEEE
jgi:hypothetical protein